MKISYAIAIQKPAADVFPWIADPEKAMQWQTNVKGGQIITSTPNKIGTTFVETIAEAGGSLEMRGEITQYVENELIGFHLESRIHAVDVQYIVAADQDCSRVSVDSTIKWKFPMNALSFLLGKKMESGIMQQLETEFTILKQLCENSI